jgi:hypothetical protein
MLAFTDLRELLSKSEPYAFQPQSKYMAEHPTSEDTRRKIFISYRRADSANITGRIHDRLIGRFGRENVFMDVDDMQSGAYIS